MLLSIALLRCGDQHGLAKRAAGAKPAPLVPAHDSGVVRHARFKGLFAMRRPVTPPALPRGPSLLSEPGRIGQKARAGGQLGILRRIRDARGPSRPQPYLDGHCRAG